MVLPSAGVVSPSADCLELVMRLALALCRKALPVAFFL